MVDIGKLKRHPKNRNRHPKEQIKALAEIIKYQGWRKPIIVSKRSSGYMTAGHGRLEVAELLKMKQVPVNYQHYKDWKQEYADVQSDNAIALWADLDLSGIKSDVKEFGSGFQLDLLGIKDFKSVSLETIKEKELDENIETKTECPSCGYKW